MLTPVPHAEEAAYAVSTFSAFNYTKPPEYTASPPYGVGNCPVEAQCWGTIHVYNLWRGVLQALPHQPSGPLKWAKPLGRGPALSHNN